MLKLLDHELSISKFPAGETNLSIKFNAKEYRPYQQIIMNYQSNDDIVNLFLLVDAIRRKYSTNTDIRLTMDYIPYARQDRVCNQGESLSLKVFCDMINSLKFTSVAVCDAHSDVALALLDNVVHQDLLQCFVSGYKNISNVYSNQNVAFISPDAGAMKKVSKVGKHFDKHVYTATKVRDTKTGWITDTHVDIEKHLGYTDLYVLDDIADGGATFILLVKELRKFTNGKIILFTTHGIYSQGKKILEDVFDEVVCYNDFTKLN